MGVISIIGGISKALTEYLADKPIDFTTLITTITAGIGLIVARDNNVSSEQVGIK